MDHSIYRHVILAGDRVRDVLLPDEGKHRLSLAKESDSDEPLNRIEAIKKSGGLTFLEWMLTQLGIKGDIVLSPANREREEIHWGLRLLPKDLYAIGRSAPKVYRVTDRHLHTPRFHKAKVFAAQARDDSSIFERALTLIAAYGHDVTKQVDWESYGDAIRCTTDTPTVRRIILLARRLPYPVIKGRPPTADEQLWKLIYDKDGRLHPSQRDTLIITSLDRLRQDGAQISKRVSWDKTLEDFANQIDNFPPLQRLGLFGHLVVRIGVSGAFYCRTCLTPDGAMKSRRILLLYDPRAHGGIYRDLLSQGNVFGTRAAYAACIVKALLDGGPGDQDSLIANGITQAIRTSQFLYREGFGDTLAKVRSYPQHLEVPLKKHLNKTYDKVLHTIEYDHLVTHTEWGILYAELLCGHTDIEGCNPEERNARRLLLEYRRFRCAMQISLSGSDAIVNRFESNEWAGGDASRQCDMEEALLELTLAERMDVETEVAHYFEDLRNDWLSVFPADGREADPSPQCKNSKELQILFCRAKRAKADFEQLAKQLRTEPLDKEQLKIAVVGILDHIVGTGSVSDIESEMGALDPADAAAFMYCEKRLPDNGDRLPMTAHPSEAFNGAQVKATLEQKLAELKQFAERLQRIGTPFNFPIGRFGRMRVVGRKEVEAFNDIRNRMLFHIQSGARKPLSLAVFGPPGSGKSFGVTEIASEFAPDLFEEIQCNLSQGADISFLDKTFVKIGDVIATGKIPLVFFDEFDSTIPGQGPLSWLKYFLQPMQDGYYQHPDGRMSVGRSIFIFAGGTHETYEAFRLRLIEEKNRPEKLLDFVSRLKGFVNIPHVSPCKPAACALEKLGPVVVRTDQEEIPYLRRAMLIRSLLEQKRLIRPFNNQPADCGDCGYGLIDVDLLRALLLVNTYRHGARSIAAILDIASPLYNTIAKASLPNNEQLDMHTEEEDFNLLLKDLLQDGNLSETIKSRLLNGTWKPRESVTVAG